MIADTGVSAIIGIKASRSDSKSGVFWVQMEKQSVLPAVVLSQIAGAGIPTMDGPSSLRKARIQFSCYGMKYSDAKKLARAVRNLLDGFAGPLPNGVEVGNTMLLLEADTFEDAPFSFNCPMDFEFWYTESGN